MSGCIGYFKLGKWWRESFDEAERAAVDRIFADAATLGRAPKMLSDDDLRAAMGEDAPPTLPGSLTLITGDVGYVERDAAGFLDDLADLIEAAGHDRFALRVRAKSNVLKQEKSW